MKTMTFRIVDQEGRAVPHVQLTTDNGIVCYTQSKGNVAWNESSLMNRDAYFRIESPGYQFAGGGTTLHITRGGQRVMYRVSPDGKTLVWTNFNAAGDSGHVVWDRIQLPRP